MGLQELQRLEQERRNAARKHRIAELVAGAADVWHCANTAGLPTTIAGEMAKSYFNSQLYSIDIDMEDEE